MKTLILVLVACLPLSLGYAADHIVIGNVSRTVEQLPNYAATDKGFFAQEGIEADVVLIGSTDTLIQALIAGHAGFFLKCPAFIRATIGGTSECQHGFFGGFHNALEQRRAPLLTARQLAMPRSRCHGSKGVTRSV